MITTAEIVHGLAGAARIIRFDVRVRDWFDDSLVAARRSFWGAALGLPFSLLIELVPAADAAARAPGFDLALFLVKYAIGWTAYPLAAWHLTRAFGLGAYFARYLAAYNWAQTVLVALFAPIIALVNGGGGGDAAIVVGFGLTGLYVAYAIFTARVMLGAAYGPAVILVVCDVLILQAIDQLVVALRAGPLPAIT